MNEQIRTVDSTDEEIGDLQYELHNGYLHAWLVAGPVKSAVHDMGNYHGADFKAQIARAYYRPAAIESLSPAEGRKFESQDPNGDSHSLSWQVARCADDHYVNLSGFYHTCHYLTAWAYAKVIAPVAQLTKMTLTTNGPADLWLNGQHLHRQEHFALQRPQSEGFTASMQEGENEFLIRFEVVAARACPFLMALQLEPNEASSYHVRLPTTRLPLARRAKLEKLFDLAYLRQSVYHGFEELIRQWPNEMEVADRVTVPLQSADGRIYAEARPDVQKGKKVNLGPVYQVPDGDYTVTLMPSIEEYYLHQMQVEKRIPLRIINNKHAETASGIPSSTIEDRRRETLVHAAQGKINLYSEIARMALGDWKNLRLDVVRHAIERINQRVDCADFDMVGLLGALTRDGDLPDFPPTLKEELAACAVRFKYWMDEPGEDAMCYWTENHQILFHTCQLLAGQLFPEVMFSNTNQKGAWHQAKGEERALSWLRKRALNGFQEWDSNCYFNENVLALTHLAELAANDTVAEMAAVVLDKLCFTMALNSFNGVFGSTHGRSYTSLILGGRGERTSGISRLLWGQGTLNSSITGAVAVACAQSYELPPIIEAIANDRTQPLWNRERHAGQCEKWCDLDDNPWEVNKVTYKTPEYMLSSAQDYRPGEEGFQQHIWQATLSPDAVIFVNHPLNAHVENDLRPNFWSGNGILPRVAQWKESLIAIYRLPTDDWMGWTHAYFPIAAFDDFEMRDGWAFGRKGEGYVALWAANGLSLQEQGAWAYREIRSPGLHNIWLCQMGRRAKDGSFADFMAAVIARKPHFDDLAVNFQNARGESLAFAWEGPLLVNSVVEPITGFRHYDNLYCQSELGAEEMVIHYQDQQMLLNFALDTSLEPLPVCSKASGKINTEILCLLHNQFVSKFVALLEMGDSYGYTD